MSDTERLQIQALGAALSRRDWHATEQAYAAIRDTFDRRPAPQEPTEGPIREHLTQTMLTHLRHMARVRPAGLDRDAAEWAIGELERRDKLGHQAFRLAVHHQERADSAESTLRYSVSAERERCARIVDAEAAFARENMDAIPDEAELVLENRLTPRYYWGQRLTLAKHYASEIRSPAVAEQETKP